MCWAFDLYYKPPANWPKEVSLSQSLKALGGRNVLREEPVGACVCLTFEYDGELQAELAATHLRRQGEHVEGPFEYGD